MTNYDQMKNLIEAFGDKYNQHICMESSLSIVSEDKDNSKNTGEVQFVYNGKADMSIIDMDEIAHKMYRVIRNPDSKKDDESLASADAFVINSEDIWYFIEFKNQKISKAKDSVTKKAYQNWFWLVDILYEMSEKNNMQYDTFNYDNPISFAREKVVFILVVSEDKNIVDADKCESVFLQEKSFSMIT